MPPRPSGQPVTFNGGTLLLPNTDHGDVSAGVMVKARATCF